MEITRVIEEITRLPNVFIDRNYGQGYDALRRHFIVHKIGIDQLDAFIDSSRRRIRHLEKMFEPYQLPPDYLFFLEQYGGIAVSDGRKPMLDIFGVGPLADIEYSPVIDVNENSPHHTHKNIFIAAGESPLSEEEKAIMSEVWKSNPKIPDIVRKGAPKSQQVSFYIDLQGAIQSNSIIAIKDIEVLTQNNQWELMAFSFTEWIKMNLTNMSQE